jgi:hypothetical protein
VDWDGIDFVTTVHVIYFSTDCEILSLTRYCNHAKVSDDVRLFDFAFALT